MKYEDFIDLEYEPKENELICDFFVEPIDGVSIENVAGGVAAESSTGTWTELTTRLDYMKDLYARVFEINGNQIRVAYPPELFEGGNMPNILSSVAGNVFGLGTIKNLRLFDIHFPLELAKTFPGPKFGIDGVRNILGVYDRPIVGTVIKPKLGLKTKDYLNFGYQAWTGGCDFLKHDENMADQSFNRFEDNVVKGLELRDRAEEETGEKKVYFINVTAEAKEMERRANLVKDQGGEYIMIDILTAGWAGLQMLRNLDDFAIHCHRAFHAAFTKNPKHGVSMKVISKITRLMGGDQLHVGTGVGKMSEGRGEVIENKEALEESIDDMEPTLPVASGGLHPGHIPDVLDIFGRDVCIQIGGGIHSHKDGTKAGAKAVRQAVNAAVNEVPLKDHADAHPELKTILKQHAPDMLK